MKVLSLPYKKGLWLIPPLIFGVLVVYFYWINQDWVYTENAYVKTDFIAISTEVTGRVKKIGVSENQKVQQGDFLFSLDPEPFQYEIDRLKAQLQVIQNTIHTQKAIYQQKQSEKELAKKILLTTSKN